MMAPKRLFGPLDLASEVGRFFRDKGNVARLQVSEDVAFDSPGWLDLGSIEVFPGDSGATNAVLQGAYHWTEPDEATMHSSLGGVLTKPDKSEGYNRSIGRVLDGIEFAKQRLGFLKPLFDAYRFAEFPYRRPVTIVSDTTGVQQGALDFVARFLSPCARIKIPAVVQMEILLRADNYFKARGKKKTGPGTVADHILSQGGQRTLLRLEADPDVEVERAHLVDPLRGIIFPASDPEEKALGLQDIHRSFADRLIFESARQHRTDANYGHPTYLLTSDQGLARMSTAEGLPALFFQSPKARFGRVLSGVQVHPFGSKLVSIPLLSVLWEFAVCFGAARLFFSDSDSIEVWAMGNEVSWQPFHCREDLLWVKISEVIQSGNDASSVGPVNSKLNKQESDTNLEESELSTSGSAGSYSVNPQKLIKIADYFRSHDRVEEAELGKAIGISIGPGLEEVKRFLEAGEFTIDGTRTDKMSDLIDALDQRDIARSLKLVSRVHSFSCFLETLKKKIVLKEKDVTKRAFEYYGALAEIFGQALKIPDDGLYWAARNPLPTEFASFALQAYRKLSSSGQDFVLTGAWLEELARSYGVHPLVAKMRLEEARASGLVNRYFEGSTPETSYERHKMLIFNSSGKLQVAKVGLYRGDFLSEHKQSVSIRVEEGRS